MSIPRVKGAGWGVNEKLTSAQMSDVDLHCSWALDKRSGQTDTLASNVTVSGATLFQGNVTFDGFAVTINSFLTLTGIVSATGTTVFTSGGSVTFQGTTQLVTRALTWALGGNVTFGAANNTTNGATGFSTTLNGQNCTGTGSTGGDVIINSGSGTSMYGVVRLHAAGQEVLACGQNAALFSKRVGIAGGSLSLAWDAPAFGTPNVTMDFSTANHWFIGAATADTYLVPTNPIGGTLYTVSYLQNATGGHNIGWGGGHTYAFGALGITPDAGANKRTIWQFLFHNGVFY